MISTTHRSTLCLRSSGASRSRPIEVLQRNHVVIDADGKGFLSPPPVDQRKAVFHDRKDRSRTAR